MRSQISQPKLFNAMALEYRLLTSPSTIYIARHLLSFPLQGCSSSVLTSRPLSFLPASSSPILKAGSKSRSFSCSANLAVSVPDMVESPTVESKKALQLEDLQWRSTFVDELPGDPQKGGPVRQVRNACYSFVDPSLALKDPKLLVASQEAATLIELDTQEFERPELPIVFSGGMILKGSKPYAQCYGGHQFGQWAGQLGDGRAISLGEVLTGGGDIWELQLKGVGKTPYSRHADGRAVLRSSVREFLASEALFGLGIPTTRALCLVSTGEEVLRDMFYNGNAKMEPGAAVCRMAPSFLRFGSWQIHASRGGVEAGMGRLLANYVIKYHFPHLANLPEPDEEGVAKGAVNPPEAEGQDPKIDVTKNKFTAWFAEVAERTAVTVAGWQSVGFTHGVLNTDNMSILGLTIDYGPFGFLDAFDPQYTPNTTDLPGRRYCYQSQPDVGMWNIVQLANSLLNLNMMGTEEAQFCVSRYADTFLESYQKKMTAKLGLKTYHKEGSQKLLKLMAADKTDFTNLFRHLSNVPSRADVPSDADVASADVAGADLLKPLESVLGQLSAERSKAWVDWVKWYGTELKKEGVSDGERKKAMDGVNPKYILRNYLAQTAILAAEKGDMSEMKKLYEVLRRPFTEQEGMEEYAGKAPEWAKKPGVSLLSCSS